MNPLSATREHGIAFRLYNQHLDGRMPPGTLHSAARTCGLQNTPPGSAALALQARVEGIMPGEVERALVSEKTLVQAWSLRTAPLIFPTADLPVFTRGLLPASEEEMRAFLRGAVPALVRIGIGALEVVDLTAAALGEVLDGREMTKDELGLALAQALLPSLAHSQAVAWGLPSWYAPGQSMGESVVRFVLPVLSLMGLICHAERRGNQAYLALTGQWLGAPVPWMSSETAQEALVRRYLHAHGPSTAQHFAAWAGIAPSQAKGAWRQVEGELVEVDFAGRRAWLLVEDLSVLINPAEARGLRLLPPHDPFLDLRDRETLVADRALQRYLWRTSGNPGAVLQDGEIVAGWRHEKNGMRLKIIVEPFSMDVIPDRESVEAEATSQAVFTGIERIIVEIAKPRLAE
jgi:hypothetical protein